MKLLFQAVDPIAGKSQDIACSGYPIDHSPTGKPTMPKMLTVAVPRLNQFLGGAALTLTLSACGDVTPDGEASEHDIAVETSEIQNGTRYSGDGWGWGAVKLEIWWPHLNRYGFCSGQVVSRQTILTAAHCLPTENGTNSSYTNVRAFMQTGGGVVVVLNALSHVQNRPEYQACMGCPRYDVGLITAPSVDLLKNVAPRDAAWLAKTNPSGLSMVAVGYGYMNDTTYDGLGRLATVVPTYNSSRREYNYSATGTMPQMCFRDSGGPLKWGGANTSFGVYSAGAPVNTGNCYAEAFWATTAQNMDWLRGKIKGTCSESTEVYSCW